MNKTMRALVKVAKGPGLIELKDVPVPRIGDSEVLIEVHAAGICGTDLHIFHDRFPYWPPVILGHEFAGIISEVGSQVKSWKVGDRVVGEPHTLACGRCRLCRTGNRQICPEKRSPGWGIDGCFARYMRFPEPALLHAVPEGLSLEEASLVEPTANAVHHVLERGRVNTADTVVIIGPGPIGLLCAMTAKAGGAAAVAIVGTDADEAERLPLARRLKAIDLVLNAGRDDVVARVLEMTEGRGADLIVETSGSVPGIATAFAAVRKLGRITAIGFSGRETVPVPYDSGLYKAVRLTFNMSTSYTSWDKAIHLLHSHQVEAAPLITHQGGLDQWEEFFKALDQKQGIKGIFLP
jgi:L-iditol 2-dehydrogenase